MAHGFPVYSLETTLSYQTLAFLVVFPYSRDFYSSVFLNCFAVTFLWDFVNIQEYTRNFLLFPQLANTYQLVPQVSVQVSPPRLEDAFPEST